MAAARRVLAQLQQRGGPPTGAQLNPEYLARTGPGRPPRMWLRLNARVRDAYARATAGSKESHLQTFCLFLDMKQAAARDATEREEYEFPIDPLILTEFARWLSEDAMSGSKQTLLNYLGTVRDWICMAIDPPLMRAGPAPDTQLDRIYKLCLNVARREDPRRALPYGRAQVRAVSSAREKFLLVLAFLTALRASSLCSIAEGDAQAELRSGETISCREVQQSDEITAVRFLVPVVKTMGNAEGVKLERREAKIFCNCAHSEHHGYDEFCIIHNESLRAELVRTAFPIPRDELSRILEKSGRSFHSSRRAAALAIACMCVENPQLGLAARGVALNAIFFWAATSKMFVQTYSQGYEALRGRFDFLPIVSILRWWSSVHRVLPEEERANAANNMLLPHGRNETQQAAATLLSSWERLAERSLEWESDEETAEQCYRMLQRIASSPGAVTAGAQGATTKGRGKETSRNAALPDGTRSRRQPAGRQFTEFAVRNVLPDGSLLPNGGALVSRDTLSESAGARPS